MRVINVLLFGFLWILSVSINAQDVKLITTLSELIPELEKEHNVKFNYLESSGLKQITLPLTTELNSTLKLLEQQTQLRF